MFLLFFSWTWKKNVIILWAKSCRSRDYRTALNVAILTVPGWPASLGAVMFWYGVSKPSQSSSLTAITWPPCWGSSLLHQMGSILKNSRFSLMNFQAWCCIQMEFLSTSFLSNWRSYRSQLFYRLWSSHFDMKCQLCQEFTAEGFSCEKWKPLP